MISKVTPIKIDTPTDFVPFNPYGEVKVYQRNLPHWRQTNATYFVTFRLADSVPKKVTSELKRQRTEWETALATSRRNSPDDRIPDSIRAEYEAFQRRYWKIIEGELDGSHGRCELKDPKIRKVVSNAFSFFENERYQVFSYVVMPNHCHLLLKPASGHPLEDILASWKSFTGSEINKLTGRSGNFWRKENFDRIVRDENHFRKCVHYILKNPTNAGLSPHQCETWMAETVLTP